MRTFPLRCAFSRLGLLIVALSLAPRGVYSDQVPAGARTLPRAEDLLVQSYEIGKGFSTAERVYLLTELNRAGAEIRFPRTQQWADEEFHLTFELPHEWNRVASQRNALGALSAFDPARAMKLIYQMDQTPPVDGRLPQDLRANCAALVFPNYWKAKGPKAFDRLRSEARQLAQSGEYPYVAVADIIKSSALQPEQIGYIVADASIAYEKGSPFEIADREYVYFLKAVQSKARPDQFRRSLEYAVDRLIAKGDAEKQKRFTQNTYTSKGTLTLTKMEDELLFELLPMAKQSDPELADKIVTARADFRKVEGADIIATEGAYGSAEGRSKALEMSRVREVAAISSKDPQQALTLAQSIGDPALKATALVYVAGGLQQTEPEKSAQIIETVKQNVSSIGPGESKVRMFVALAQAAAASKDVAMFDLAFHHGLDLGTELFGEDAESHPAKPAYNTAAFEELSDLVTVGAGFQPQAVLQEVLELQSDVLKAYMLIEIAKVAHQR